MSLDLTDRRIYGFATEEHLRFADVDANGKSNFRHQIVVPTGGTAHKPVRVALAWSSKITYDTDTTQTPPITGRSQTGSPGRVNRRSTSGESRITAMPIALTISASTNNDRYCSTPTAPTLGTSSE